MLTLLTVVTGPDDPITQPTNRGNKLKTNATHVREGALGYINSEELYKKVDLLPLSPQNILPQNRSVERKEEGSPKTRNEIH